MPFVGAVLFILTLFFWSRILVMPLSMIENLSVIVGAVLLVFPVSWIGRRALDKHPTQKHAAWITLFIHIVLMILLGAAIIRAVATFRDWHVYSLPVPLEIGAVLALLTGVATLLTVVNLALRGFGAPFAIILSQKLAIDWMYAWTRNPMILAILSFLLALGVFFQSMMFVLWVLVLVAPAWLAFVKIYEERELEIRFGTSYLEYKSRTPLLLPRKPKSWIPSSL